MTADKRAWSRSEELANSLSHFAGFLAALAGAPFLFAVAAHQHSLAAWIGMSVFVFTSALLYLSSALHHWMRPGRAKDFFEVLDHAAIFLMIAGTYTPFALGALWGPWGWLLLGVIWPLAIFGVLLKTRNGLHAPRSTITLYVAMGWLMVVAFRPLILHVPITGVQLIVAGGLAYTGGLIFYLGRRFPFHHLGWHLSVLLGTACHYFAILHYAYPG